MPPVTTSLIVILSAYVIGAIPTGFIVAKQLKGIDIREHGSGNVGATNVKRVVGNKAGLTVLIIDFLKALLPVLAVKFWFPELPVLHVLTAIGVIIGHSRSVFLGFSGGKSAISGLGSIVALNWMCAIIIAAVAFTIIKTTRVVSIGSMTAAILSPVLFFVFQSPFAYTVYALVCSLYIIYLHRANIQRLMQGTENQL